MPCTILAEMSTVCHHLPPPFLPAGFLQCHTEQAASAFQFFWGKFIQIVENTGNRVIFIKETHKGRRLLPNPALSGRCIEDFYPLVYFFGGYVRGYLICFTKTCRENTIEKTHLTPLTERKTLKDNTFCYYLHDYG